MNTENGKPPGAAPPGEPDAVLPRRLHLSTLWIPLLRGLPGLVLLVLAAGFVMGKGMILGLFGFWYLLLFVAAYHVLRYATFQYRLDRAELVLQSGVLWRHERRIPFSRIQDIKLHQGLFDQLFKVAKVVVTTAGSERQEAVLDVISTKEAALLRAAVFGHERRVGKVEYTDTPKEEISVVRLTLNDLFLGGLTSQLAATLGALLGAVIYFKLFLTVGGKLIPGWDVFPGLLDWEEELRELLPIPGLGWLDMLLYPLRWSDTFGGAILIALGALFFSLSVYAIRYYRYRLTRSGNVLTKQHGLLTFRSTSVVRDHIQALKVEEGLLRRWFGLAAVWADSGGDRSESEDEKKREPLIPVVARQDAFRLVGEVFADLPDPEPVWNRVSRRAIWRGSRLGWLILLLVMLPNGMAFLNLGIPWLLMVWLPGFPLIFYLNLRWYRNRGYWIDDDFVMSRKGWFNRQTLYLPVNNVQNVSVTQNYFDRRLKLATISVDTAGQTNTGGGPRIRNLPFEEARRIQKDLVSRVALKPIWTR